MTGVQTCALPICQIGAPGFASISRAKPSFASLALTLLRAAPLIAADADKQRSLRCAAALIITSCASVSLTLMIQPFLSSWKSGRSGPLTRTSPGSVNAEGAVGSRARLAPRLTTTPMLPFERKASPYRIGRAIVVNGRISCFASVPSLPQRAGRPRASSGIKPESIVRLPFS